MITDNNNSHRCRNYFIIFLLVIPLVAPLLILPSANGHTPPWSIPTHAFIGISPNPIGVGQTAIIQFGLDIIPPTANATGGDRWGNMLIRVTKPDGTIETLGPFISNATGHGLALYTPTMIGTYFFMVNFPGQVLSKYNPLNGLPGIDSEFVNDTYLASGAQAILTVQSQPVHSSTPTPSISPQPSIVQTNAFVSVRPNPVGIGEIAQITLNISPYPPQPYNLVGLTLEITKPDGIINMLGPYICNETGSVHVTYVPTMIGTYRLQLKYPGQYLYNRNENYLASTSSVTSLTVQPEPTITTTSPPTSSPTFSPTPIPWQTTTPTATHSAPAPSAPPATLAPTSTFVMQRDNQSSKNADLHPVTVAIVAIAAVIIVFVALTLRRLYSKQ